MMFTNEDYVRILNSHTESLKHFDNNFLETADHEILERYEELLNTTKAMYLHLRERNRGVKQNEDT